ncbi:hypothetical protein Cgig2_011335 [Carnegiea gigantea]|uniref:DUF4283 domain-containing protein n=1 Tax=Carnegiea gigantea TaxID=171969 RepID=A0A9Q1Q6D7_9CARY|nr:hypothetical protein Cgig2_011335 [Carnegiea gigantea]
MKEDALIRRKISCRVDLAEGTALKYIPTVEINRQKCVKIEKNDILLEEFVHCIWANKSIDKVVLTRKGLFLVRFTNIQDKLDVIQRGVYFFDKKPFIVEVWNGNLSLDTSSLQSLPIWVQFLELDINKLGSMLGMPIKMDRTTKERTDINYARLLIEMPLEGPFPDHIDFIND